ncbi:MAG: penicillin-binding protein 2 [Parvularculaceae bacterium]
MFKRRDKKRARCYVIDEGRQPAEPAIERISAESRRKKNLASANRRIGLCAVAFGFAFSALALRLVLVSTGTPPTRVAVSASQNDKARPEIVDRNDILLAANLPMRSLEIAGREVWSAKETSVKIASVLPDIDAAALEEKLAAGRYVEVKTRLTPAQEKEIFSLGLPGVRFRPHIRRFYPQSKIASHIVGQVEPGKGGVSGLEYVLDEHRAIQPLISSIDIRAQQIVEQELEKSLLKFKAKAAMGAVMDVHTGEILALVSLPDFDPNDPGAYPADFRRNRFVYDRYELGSAFKLFTASAALEDGVATERTTYDARKPYRVADRLIHDFHPENRVLTFAEVIEHSSNIGAAQMAEALGPKALKSMLEKFGLLDPLPIDLVEKRAPEPPKKWGPVETATVAYGHGISVTPLHLLTAASSVVNGGVWRAPTLIRSDAHRPDRRVISENNSAIMRRVMRNVIVNGTASLAEAPGYFPIGKTATADKPVAGGYNTHERIASFVGAFPGYNPRYALLVTLDEPQAAPGTYGYATAGWNAAPTFAAITQKLAPILGVMPVSEVEAFAAFHSGQSVPLDRSASLMSAPAGAAP